MIGIINVDRSSKKLSTEIAAALAKLVQGKEPLLLKALPAGRKDKKSRGTSARIDSRGRNESRGRGESKERRRSPKSKGQQRKLGSGPESGMETYRIEVGHDHDVQPGNIVGAIANEAANHPVTLMSCFNGGSFIFDGNLLWIL